MRKALWMLLILVGVFLTGTTEVWAQEEAPAVDESPAWVDTALYISYGLVILAAAAAILMPLVQSAGNPRSLLKSGLGVLAILAVFLIAYAISGNEVTPRYTAVDPSINPSSSKLIGGGLITSYLLGIIALASIVFTEVSSIFK